MRAAAWCWLVLGVWALGSAGLPLGIAGLPLECNNEEAQLQKAVTESCQTFTDYVKFSLPIELTYVFHSIAMLPDYVIVSVFNLVVPGSTSVTQAYLSCWRSQMTAAFGQDPSVATAAIRSHGVRADLYFSQTLAREGTQLLLAAVGRFSGLVPYQRYRLSLSSAGGGEGCGHTGSEDQKFRGATFTANAQGKALLLLQDTSVLIEGPRSVLGRQAVVAPVGAGAGPSFCGVVVRNSVQAIQEEQAADPL